MEYCRLHKDLTEEEGDGCPLCESMIEKASIVNRWADDRRKMQAQLATVKARLGEAEGLFENWMLNELNHVFQNSTLQEDTKALLSDMEAVKEVEGG